MTTKLDKAQKDYLRNEMNKAMTFALSEFRTKHPIADDKKAKLDKLRTVLKGTGVQLKSTSTYVLDYLDFGKDEVAKKNQALYDKFKAKVQLEYDQAMDGVMLGDSASALDALKAFRAAMAKAAK